MLDSDSRILAIGRALEALAAHPDPASLSDGLSSPLAARCLGLALGEIRPESLARAIDIPGRPPRDALFVAARGVFTSPLEWVVLLLAMGSRLHLKAPSAAPGFCMELTRLLKQESLPIHCSTSHALPQADAVIAMGGDSAMRAISTRFRGKRLSLHGHRFSVALVQNDHEELADALADDLVLYDGRGCFTPAAIFVQPPASPERLALRLAESMKRAQERYPRGFFDPAHGPEWRRRIALARARGLCHEGNDLAVTLLGTEYFAPAALPRLAAVHPLGEPQELQAILSPWRAHLTGCATDLLDTSPLLDLGFDRICQPGRLQIPPLGRPHGGRNVLGELCFLVSMG